MGLTDIYDLRARLYPALLALAPVGIVVVAMYGNAIGVANSVYSVLAVCGGAFALSRLARDRGKRIQDQLYKNWGGAPTTQLLRHRNSEIDAHTKQRYHKVLAGGLGFALPDETGEAAAPDAADRAYQAATIWLIGQTRDTKAFPLVFKENIAYGFHRNALGVRPLGVGLALIGVLWAVVNTNAFSLASPFLSVERLTAAAPGVFVSMASCVGLALWWFFGNTEASVRRTGFAYAERLLQSCDRLQPKAKTATKKRTPTGKAASSATKGKDQEQGS